MDAINNAFESAKNALNPHLGESDTERTQRKAKETAESAGDATKGAVSNARDAVRDTAVSGTDAVQGAADDVGKRIERS
jgi:hypothetical protein